MCGIAGIINFDGAPVDPDWIGRMNAALAHRGPDGEGTWVRGNAGLGHRRLAIRDLSEAAHQPMVHDDRYVVSYNGEIYNDRDLRAQIEALGPVHFGTHADTAVIAPAYRAWGDAAFDRFEGMFAIALWDAQAQRLVLARDAVGIKPLYYSRVGDSLRFASEVKALLALPDQPRRLSAADVYRFVAQGYPGPTRSLVEGVQSLPPGSVLVADRAGMRVTAYWQPARRPRLRNVREAVDAFEPLFARVVEDTLVSDVPVGLLLSGGIDSALIAGALSGRGVRAYTARFAQRSFDESPAAAEVARHFALEQTLIDVTADDGIEQRFLRVVHHYDGHCADSSGLAFHALCEAARPYTKVLLTGDGADEFFAGYPTYRASRLAGWAPRAGMRLLGRALLHMGVDGQRKLPRSEKLARFCLGIAEGGDAAHAHWRQLTYAPQLQRLLGPAARRMQFDPATVLAPYEQALAAAGGIDLVDRCLVADQSYYLPGDLLIKSDAMSMASGTEVRVPFLDRRMMDFAGSLDNVLLTPLAGPDKHVLRAALARSGLPASHSQARKQGFNVPIAGFLRSGLRNLGERLLGKEADALAPMLSPAEVRRLWREHLDGRGHHSYTLWALLTLAAWREMTQAK